MSGRKTQGRIVVGSWVLCMNMTPGAMCIDCRREVAVRELSWRAKHGSTSGRRVCGGCMERRQAWRRPVTG